MARLRSTRRHLSRAEEQLTALQHTKADMRALRAHMAGLEDELEHLSTANAGLRRELAHKNETIDRHVKRAEVQQEKVFALEAEAEAATNLRTSLIDVREESSKWRERCLGAEQRLSEVGRSHELLLATLVGTCERLLSPFGVSPEDSALPLAWQQQLHSELSAVIQAPLVVQASRDIQSAHQHAVDAASVVPTAEAPVTPSAPPADVQEVGTAGTAGARQRRESSSSVSDYVSAAAGLQPQGASREGGGVEVSRQRVGQRVSQQLSQQLSQRLNRRSCSCMLPNWRRQASAAAAIVWRGATCSRAPARAAARLRGG